jgi:hypothetical protein
MSASLEAFRKVDGSRIAAVSVFPEAATIVLTAVRQAAANRFSFDEQSRSNQRRDRHLLPAQ